MSDVLDLPELPFPGVFAQAGAWRYDEATAAVVATAPAGTDLYRNPGGEEAGDAASKGNAATLLGTPPPGDHQLSARVSVDFRSTFDAGVLLIWVDEQNWAKLCFEFSPASEPMVVSVVTRGVSDDANAFVVPGRSVWLRVSRTDRVYAYHASTDGVAWQLVRVFTLGEAVSEHQIGFEVQSPTGGGCTATFDRIRFAQQRLADLRDGS